jgi:protein-S-isoprenylcysteine O-methyltransferase Ste14
MENTLVPQAAALVLAAVFAWAAVVKLLEPDRWRKDLLVYRLGRPLRAAGWLILPWLEVAVPAALLIGHPRMAALLAAGLMGVFSVAILRARILVGSDQLACGCFGGHATRDYRLLLIRNALLAGLAVYVLAFPAPGISIRSGLASGLLLGVVGLIAAVWTFRQLRLRREERTRMADPGGPPPQSGAAVSPGQRARS